ncbi:ABC transporter permease [Pseudolabrys sp.]|uniref:ABC transporter permease n=1 Tax=Pseudolabrys sp. TaxID=1960880 RepID=UPI003D0E0CAD
MLANRLTRIYGIVAIAIVWEVVSRLEILPSQFFPPLSTVLMALWETLFSESVWRDEALTIGRALSGVAVAAGIGITLAVAASSSEVFDAMLAPIVELLRPIPPAAMIPISIFFLGIGKELFLFTIAFASVWPIYVSTANALNSVDRVLIDTGRSFGCGRLEELILIRFPVALPEIFTGLRVGIGIAFLATIVVEMLAGRGGIGFQLFDSAFSLQIPLMFAFVIIAGINGSVLNWVTNQVRYLLTAWHLGLSRQLSASHPAE